MRVMIRMIGKWIDRQREGGNFEFDDDDDDGVPPFTPSSNRSIDLVSHISYLQTHKQNRGRRGKRKRGRGGGVRSYSTGSQSYRAYRGGDEVIKVSKCLVYTLEILEMNVSPWGLLSIYSRHKQTYIHDIQGKGSWTWEEDDFIRQKVVEFGQDWSRIAMLIPGRISKQVR